MKTNLVAQSLQFKIPIDARKECNVCSYSLDSLENVEHSSVNCNVRAFKEEYFRVWRCPICHTIHCLDVVDLEHYYSKYPVSKAMLTWISRLVFEKQYSRLSRFGIDHSHLILDYGCGVNGQFVKFMLEKGFLNCFGYDPYAPLSSFGNPLPLTEHLYDFVVLQDVIEHVENPVDALRTIDDVVKPGSYILVGTPNAETIDLYRPEIPEFVNALHAPFHLHIYTRKAIEDLAFDIGWEPVMYFDRSIEDTMIPGFNTRTWNFYTKHIGDNTFDSIYEDINLIKALNSYRFIYYSFLGYWLSYRVNMAILFRKL